MNKPAQTDDSTLTTPGTPGALTTPSAPTKRARRTATGPLKGRPRVGSVEYEVYRMQSKGAHPYPWRALDATAERTVETTCYANEWETEVLRYAATLERLSISKYLLKHGVTAALKRVVKQEQGEGEVSDEP